MANVFVEYFHNVGRIFTEKNAWYRILAVLMISLIYQFSASSIQETIEALLKNIPSTFNIPLIVLALLSFVLISGYQLQVSSNRMNREDNLIPKIDFLNMFIVGLRGIPFYIVWFLYYIIISIPLAVVIVILILIFGTIMHFMHFSQNAIFLINLLVCIPAMILIIAPWFSVVAIFSKEYSYKKSLNPLLYFRLFSKTALRNFGVLFASFLAVLVLILVCLPVCIGLAKVLMSARPELAFVLGVIGVIAIAYILNVFGYALTCTVADITLEAVEGTDTTPDDDYDGNADDIIDINRADNYDEESQE